MASRAQHPLARVNKKASAPIPRNGTAIRSKHGAASKETRPREPAIAPPEIPLDHIDDDGNTGLHRAVLQEQYIYISGASKYAGCRNKAHRTALHLAAEKGDFTAIGHLVTLTGELGVRVGGPLKHRGYVLWKPTALMICGIFNHSTQMVQDGNSEPKLHDALLALIKAESKKQDYAGYTALMYACISGNIDLAMELVKFEAGFQSKGGWSALMMATQFGHLSIAAKLYRKEYGFQNAGGWTALMDAAVNGRLEIAQLLVQKERGMYTKKGKTALMLAVCNGYIDIAALLLKESGREDNTGYSALMYAVKLGHLPLVQLIGPIEGELYGEKALALLKSTATPEIRTRYQKAITEGTYEPSESDTCEAFSSENNTSQYSQPPPLLSECTDLEFLLAGSKYIISSGDSLIDLNGTEDVDSSIGKE